MYRCFQKVGFLEYQLTLGTKKIVLYEFETDSCMYWHLTQLARNKKPYMIMLEIRDEEEKA